MEALWDAMVSLATTNATQALLDAVEPVSWDSDLLVLQPKDLTVGSGAYISSQADTFTGMVHEVIKRRARVTVQVPDTVVNQVAVPNTEVAEHPDVRNVMDLFDAVVIGVVQRDEP